MYLQGHASAIFLFLKKWKRVEIWRANYDHLQGHASAIFLFLKKMKES
jgi:hypothetical protein